MELSGISSSDPFSLAPQSQSAQSLGSDAFMKLLVQQLQNQDPLDPAQGTEYVAQLANFASLEQMTNLNSQLELLTLLQQDNQLTNELTMGSLLIGQEVGYVDPDTQAEGQGIVDSVKIEDGITVVSIDGKDIPLLSVNEVLGEPEAQDAGAGGEGAAEDGSSDDGDASGGDGGDGADSGEQGEGS
jgi:flagellar basal-body rod modification protein FlgD